MHTIAIAFSNPSFCDKADVDQATLDKEKEIQLALMDNDPKMASKPLQVKEKIVLGKMSKYYEENCLMQMEFVKEKGVSVEQADPHTAGGAPSRCPRGCRRGEWFFRKSRNAPER